MEQNTANRTLGRVSAALAAVQAQPVPHAPVRFPGEDGGRSLAEMAERDLDAALQLLADRAQYITGATGAAIALRRDGRNDMLCRASTGVNAPELGALLSTEFGLSGESVRTRQLLRCDDAERDARVNREVCRELGIASVLVMPVGNDDQVLGVFELFSGTRNAFGERDLVAVKRLSEMVETAVRLAEATQNVPELTREIATDAPEQQSASFEEVPVVAVAPEQPKEAEPAVTVRTVEPPLEPKPLFWSAALNAQANAAKASEGDQSRVPPVLRGLRKCEACGFPVSAGRVLCVECEEKKWRGHLKPQAAAAKPEAAPQPVAAAAPAAATAVEPLTPIVPAAGPRKSEPGPSLESKVPEFEPQQPATGSPDFVLSAGMEPSQSWLASNKYVLIALLAIAVLVSAVFLLK